MKKIIVLLCLLMSFFLFNKLLAQTLETSEYFLEEPPPFNLENEPDDTEIMLKKKAALRLIKSYQSIVTQLHVCQKEVSSARASLKNFERRNGNTMALALKTVRQLGGMNSRIKEALAKEDEDVLQAECKDLVHEVDLGRHDLYKSPKNSADYKSLVNK